MENYEKKYADMMEKTGGYKDLYCRFHDVRKGPWASVTSRVVIDNGERRADAVVRRLMDFVDCMLEQIHREEPDTTTNYFTITADGQRMQFDAYELSLDSDEPEWQRWIDIRERFLTGSRLEFESQYIAGVMDEVHLSCDVPRLLEDLLADGKMADWVTLTVIQDNGDYADWHEFRRPYHQDVWERRLQEQGYIGTWGQRFWMNGMLDGEYICGEIPFRRDDVAVMGISRWIQTESYSWEDEEHFGLCLALWPNTRPELVGRMIRLAARFYDQLQCDIVVRAGLSGDIHLDHSREPLSRGALMNYQKVMEAFYACREPEDMIGTLSRLQGAWDYQKNYNHSNEESVRSSLALFARMREHFTDEEVETLLSANTEFQDLYTRHAAEKYTEEEIRLFRFGVCVCLILSGLNMPEEQENEARWGKATDEAALDMGWPAWLVEKVRALPEEYRTLINRMANSEISFVGMNDLSEAESVNLYHLWEYGTYIRVFNLSLENSKDIDTLERLLNELSDLEAEALNNAYELPEEEWEHRFRQSLFYASDYGWSFLCLWRYLLPQGDPRRGDIGDRYPVITNREYLDYLRETGDSSSIFEEGQGIVNDVVCFDSMDLGTHARLRFRRENGRYFHEISMMD